MASSTIYSVTAQNMWQFNPLNHGFENQVDDASYVRTELLSMLAVYKRIRDCLNGQDAVKYSDYLYYGSNGGGGYQYYNRYLNSPYLPKPNPTDLSQKNEARYLSYITRAIFYPVMKQTVLGLIGQCYIYDPISVFPDILKPYMDNVDGSCGMVQFSKNVLYRNIAFSRCGLFTDFPNTDNMTTRKDVMDGKVRPVTIMYEPEQIINWKFKQINGMQVPVLVVLKECYNDSEGNKFMPIEKVRWRVLKIDDDGFYKVEVYSNKEDSKELMLEDEYEPTMGGIRMDFIPFTALGGTSNSLNIEYPQMDTIATVNIGHYRNSADYEESSFVVGQPTPVITGLTSNWLEKELNNEIRMGSLGGIPLPVGADMKLLQVSPNTMPFEAMKHKEQQMIALGAKLIEPSNIVKTATESTMQKSDENSILASTSTNTSDALEQHMRWAYLFLNNNVKDKGYDDIEFELLTESALTNMTANERMQTVADWQAGMLTFKEARDLYKRAGLSWEEVEEITPPVQENKTDTNDNMMTPEGTVNTVSGRDFIGNRGNNSKG